jgi:DNA-binding MarR family transcriptional regulator
MAMIRKGSAGSVYDLREQYGINPGAVAHALKRLEEKGAIERPPEGYRRKRPLQVTPAGIKILEDQWESLLLAPSVEDMNALTRLAGLTMLMDFWKLPARLVAKADRLEGLARNPGSPQVDSEGSISIEFYRWMKQNARFHEIRAMAAALRDFARAGEALLPHEPD